MGGFALFGPEAAPSAEKRTMEVFSARGFTPPQRFVIGNRTLLLWRKQLIDCHNYVHGSTGKAVYAVGTPVYRRLGYGQGLHRLLRDWESGCFDVSELRGAYCLLLSDGEEIEVITDPANMFHVFGTSDGAVISSSLEAVVRAREGPLKTDRFALLEQVVTGFMTPPATPYHGVVFLDSVEQSKRNWPGLRFRRSFQYDGSKEFFHDFESCVDHQVDVLSEHMQVLRRSCEEGGVTIGISAGYDSRLVLALAHRTGLKPATHTFCSMAHALEAAVAAELAALTASPLLPVPVRVFDDLDEEQRQTNIDDALGYWDGRCNATQGTFNDVHTRSTRIMALGAAWMALSGHGGELYRNREHLPPWRFARSPWLRFFVSDPISWLALASDQIRSDLEEYLITKYSRHVPELKHLTISRHDARQWYARIWLPFAAGPKLCAENQLSRALAFFAEDRVICEALRSSLVLGSDAQLEAAILLRINPALAELPSCYGHGLDRVPRSVRARSWLIGAIPHSFRIQYSRRRVWRRKAQCSISQSEISRNSVLLNRLIGEGLPVKWSLFLSEQSNRDRALFISQFLQRLDG